MKSVNFNWIKTVSSEKFISVVASMASVPNSQTDNVIAIYQNILHLIFCAGKLQELLALQRQTSWSPYINTTWSPYTTTYFIRDFPSGSQSYWHNTLFLLRRYGDGGELVTRGKGNELFHLGILREDCVMRLCGILGKIVDDTPRVAEHTQTCWSELACNGIRKIISNRATRKIQSAMPLSLTFSTFHHNSSFTNSLLRAKCFTKICLWILCLS